ncbi:MAG: xanthine dehydrogenase family protein molybdopterin-binding subunit, partial [Stellaceae bacterium]
MLLWAARKLGRPVRWRASRAESFLSDFEARELVAEAALALDGDGRFLGLKIAYTNNLGSHPISFAVPANLLRMAGEVYDIPAIHVSVCGVVTNTHPVGVYRGAGRPESTFVLERLIDIAAATLGVGRDELRRRNLISQLPYQSPLGHRYDSGDFADNLAAALALADWAGYPGRCTTARGSGRLRGIGVANYLESPTGMHLERTDLTIEGDGTVSAVIGTQASGQGHETAFAQIVADRLQLPLDEVSIRFGDSDIAVSGGGSHSDRSMRLGGTILVRASEEVIAKGRAIAAEALEAAESDLVYQDGQFAVVGTDRSIGLYDCAKRAPLAATAEIAHRLPAHPTGAAVAEVEIDPETGAVALVGYASVDDVGTVINP